MTARPAPVRRSLTLLLASLTAAPLALTATAASAAPAVEPVPAPAILYTFDDAPGAATVANEGTLGNAFDARVRGGSTLPRGTSPFGDDGATGLFPGGPQGQSVSTTPHLDIPPGLFEDVDAMTVSTWVKWDGRNAGQLPWTYIVGSDALPADNWGLYHVPDEGGQSKAAANSGSEVKAVNQAPLSANTWTHIASVADGDSLWYYINGELVSRQSVDLDFEKLAASGSTRSGLIGRVPWASQWAALFGGELDDFAIHTSALSGEQVGQLFLDEVGPIVSVARTQWDVSTPAGVAPALPATVEVTRESGLTSEVAITWEFVPPSNYATGGRTFTATGSIAGRDEALTTTVTVTDRATEEVVADFGQVTGDFRGGATGTLYGLGDEASPTQALVNGSGMTNVSQKPPFGTQHPGGDAFQIEDTFFDKYGEDLYVYTQDYYPDWPYNRGIRPGDDWTYERDGDGLLTGERAAGGNGVWDYLEVLEIVTEEIASTSERAEDYVYIPFNEVDLQWLSRGNDYDLFMHQGGQPGSFTPDGATDWVAAWNVITDVYARNGLERPRIAGPGDAGWRGEGNIKAFLEMAIETDTVPDVYVWHELGGYQWMPTRVGLFQQYARDLGLTQEEIPEINITEWGASTDMSSPANLLRWFASMEAAKIDAQTAYWTASGTMSDNQAKVNAANGGWWLFKWYADLTGSQTVRVTTNQEKAIAAVDTDNARAQVVVAGIAADRDGSLVLRNLPADVFGTAVDVEIRENLVNGTDGVADTPPLVAAYDALAVTGGSATVRIPSTNASSAYQVIVTPATDRVVGDELPAHPRVVAEVENLDLTDARVRQPGGYRASGERDVEGFDAATSRADWDVTVEEAGLYRFTILGATPGRQAQHAVFVDDAFADVVQYGANAVRPSNVRSVARGTTSVELSLAAGEHTLSLRTSQDGTTALPGAALEGGVTLDRFELVRLGDDVNGQTALHPATTFRLFDGAALTGAAATLVAGERADLYVSAFESGYHDLDLGWTGTDVEITVDGRVATTLTGEETRVRVHLPEGISEIELRSTGGATVSSVRSTRAVEGDAAIVRVQAEDLALDGTAAVTGFGDQLTNGSGSGYVTGLGITDAVAANEGTMTLPRGDGFDRAGSYNVVVHFSNDDIEGTHDYNPQVVDLGLQATEEGSDGLAGRSTFRYTYTATNFWEAVMPLDLATDAGAVTFGNTRETLVIDERTGQQDQIVLEGYAVAPDVDWIGIAPFVLDVTDTPGPEPISFVDVTVGDLFYDEISWLASAGISTGWVNADGTREFRPVQPIARDAMAAFLYRQQGSPDFQAPAVSPFTDVDPSNQFYKEITWLAEQKVTTGWVQADGTAQFRPLEPIARDAMAAFLYRLDGSPTHTAPTTSPFSDLTPATQFYAEITWLFEEGITTGWTGNDGTSLYRPLNPVNRDAMAAFLFRYHHGEA
ncbi:LamG-like jellyroll fold domain-containing protein [Serinibacter arcticus]|uniref:Glycerol-3-phosphate ABC transporter, periplasmic glycerol-3-phosphate-binding protein n=1 Tax=Serinibacter arcticus TaxID=1655435 RepID=A0A4Z1E0N4_9MICO|nr:LamG-like jellyroll fold domain-containing protein [Serinibacter arcticus]TGO05464.1 Glycerol-3-phosphate ABC transporter, periplasmic glycerol-3-phosphate-binding protein [Serinibacter arcticus]